MPTCFYYTCVSNKNVRCSLIRNLVTGVLILMVAERDPERYSTTHETDDCIVEETCVGGKGKSRVTHCLRRGYTAVYCSQLCHNVNTFLYLISPKDHLA